MSQHRCILGNWATSSMGNAKQKGSELLVGNQPSLLPWELNSCLGAAGWCQSRSWLVRSKGCRLPAWGEVARAALPSPRPRPIYSDVGRGQRGSTLLLGALLNAVYQLKEKKSAKSHAQQVLRRPQRLAGMRGASRCPAVSRVVLGVLVTGWIRSWSGTTSVDMAGS